MQVGRRRVCQCRNIRCPGQWHSSDLSPGRAMMTWLRMADPGWKDALDPEYATGAGGRWNQPGSFPTLFLHEGLHTAEPRS